MIPFRCTICGEVTASEEKPSDCPFCGVKAKYIRKINEVDGKEIFEIKNLTDESLKNLMTALNLEISDASFYKCSSEKSNSEHLRAIFKRLAKIKREHADVMRKFLGLDSVDFNGEECYKLDMQNLQEARDREEKIIKFYKKAMAEAREAKISSFFKALIEVEDGHMEILDNAA